MNRLTHSEVHCWWQKHCLAHIALCLFLACCFALLTPHGIFHSEVTFQGNFIVGLTLFSTILGYVGLLSGLPFWITRPLLGLPYAHRWLPPWVMLFSAALFGYLLLDLAAFYVFRLHFAGIIARFSWSQPFAKGYVLIAVAASASLLIQYGIYRLTYRVGSNQRMRNFPVLGYVLLGNFMFSTAFYLLAAINITPHGQVSLRNYQITHNAHAFPFYSQFISRITGNTLSLSKVEKLGSLFFDTLWQADHKLRYPLHPLHCQHHPKWNVIYIVIDAWRYDTLNAQDSPNIWQLTKRAFQFTQHFSGGNATTPGFFSLFAGLPPNYVEPFQKQKLSPLLFTEFAKSHGNLYLFSGPPLKMPNFKSLLFRDFSNEFSSDSEGGIVRDQLAINKFKVLLQHPPKDPFLAVLYLGGVHSYCSDNKIQTPFLPSGNTCDQEIKISKDSDIVPFQNRYRNTLYTLDHMLKPVLKLLNQSYASNTVIIITGDHGEEFNDSKQGFWGHTSAYTRYQTQTPLIMHTPNSHPKKIQQFTSHYDITPWLLENVCGCQNPTTDYGVGTSILANKTPSFIIQGSYLNLAIRTQKQIMEIYPSGLFNTVDLEYVPVNQTNFNAPLFSSAYEQMTRYYQ